MFHSAVYNGRVFRGDDKVVSKTCFCAVTCRTTETTPLLKQNEGGKINHSLMRMKVIRRKKKAITFAPKGNKYRITLR